MANNEFFSIFFFGAVILLYSKNPFRCIVSNELPFYEFRVSCINRFFLAFNLCKCLTNVDALFFTVCTGRAFVIEVKKVKMSVFSCPSIKRLSDVRALSHEVFLR